MNPYEILGVSPVASEAEIKTAYRKLVKKFHPDKNNAYSNPEILRINEAYEVLSNQQKRKQYDERSYANAEDIIEEDPREVYKREYIWKKNEQARLSRERKISQEKMLFKISKIINIPILVFALALLADEFLPAAVYNEVAEKGWQKRLGGSRRSRGKLVSFMQTKNFTFAVPHEVHLNYDYYDNPDLLTIEVTPLFKIVTTISLIQNNAHYTFRALETIYSKAIPLHYILLISTILTAVLRDYSKLSYMLCFLPLLLLAFVVLILT